jgi:hypothetical protein
VTFNGTLSAISDATQNSLEAEGIAALVSRFDFPVTRASVFDSDLAAGSILLGVTFVQGSVTLADAEVVANGINATDPLIVAGPDGQVFRAVFAEASTGPAIIIAITPGPGNIGTCGNCEPPSTTLAEYAFLGAAAVLLCVFCILAAGTLDHAVDHAMLSGSFALAVFSALGGTVLVPDGVVSLGLTGDACTLAAAAIHLMLVAFVAWSAVLNFYAFSQPQHLQRHAVFTYLVGWLVPTAVAVVCVVMELYATTAVEDGFCYFDELQDYYFAAGVPLGVFMLVSVVYYFRAKFSNRRQPGFNAGFYVMLAALCACGAATTLHLAVTAESGGDFFILLTVALTAAYSLTFVVALISRMRQRRHGSSDLTIDPPPTDGGGLGPYHPGGSRPVKGGLADDRASDSDHQGGTTAHAPIKIVAGKSPTTTVGRRSVGQPIQGLGETSF